MGRWRQCHSEWIEKAGTTWTYRAIGPFTGGGVLREVWWFATAASTAWIRIGFAVGESGQSNAGSFAAGRSVFDGRSYWGVGGKVCFRVHVWTAFPVVVRIPVEIPLRVGASWVIWAASGEAVTEVELVGGAVVEGDEGGVIPVHVKSVNGDLRADLAGR